MTRSCDEGFGGSLLFASIISVKWETKFLAQSENGEEDAGVCRKQRRCELSMCVGE